jgi:ubiquinone/menaquinone biosynthesis C-methylase UbiE
LHHHRFHGDEPGRKKWQNPEQILTDIGLKKGFTFVDVGCGDGFFALPASRIVGRNGTVYGVDLYPEPIDRLKEKARKEELENLHLKVAAAEETVFCSACADIVFFGNVLHDFREPEKVLGNARKMLKPAGRLVDLDWKKEPMPLGPPVNIRFSENKAKNIIEKAGFRIIEVKEAGSYHYMIVAGL